MLEYLKIKAKSLAAESRFIRLEERRAKASKRSELRQGLYDHRMRHVRPEARHTHLAYGFLRGMPYLRIEATSHTKPDWSEVSRMVGKYGRLNIKPEEIKKNIRNWFETIPVPV